MAFLILRAETNVDWINEIKDTPILGEVFMFILIFIPAVVLSFFAQAIVPEMNSDVGFTKSMLVLLPGWNLLLWLLKIRLYALFIPAWILFGIVALIKGALLIAGIDDGQ